MSLEQWSKEWCGKATAGPVMVQVLRLSFSDRGEVKWTAQLFVDGVVVAYYDLFLPQPGRTDQAMTSVLVSLHAWREGEESPDLAGWERARDVVDDLLADWDEGF